MNLDKALTNTKEGGYAFRIRGVVHHFIGKLIPRESETSAWAQINIQDGIHEVNLDNSLQHIGDESVHVQGIEEWNL